MIYYCNNCEDYVEGGRGYKLTIKNEDLTSTVTRVGSCQKCRQVVEKDWESSEDPRKPKGARSQKPTTPLKINGQTFYIHGKPKGHIVSPSTIAKALAEEHRLRAEIEEQNGEEEEGIGTAAETDDPRDPDVPEGTR